MNSNATRQSRCLLLGTLTATLAVALTACSSSSTTAKHPAHQRPTSMASTGTTPASTPATTGALTGTWSGQYSGAFTGTFRLTWRQSGSHLHGTITISNPHSRLPINGTVRGNAIRFGTVGGDEVTYSGTVSGTSMSGTYQVGSHSGGGPWSASKV